MVPMPATSSAKKRPVRLGRKSKKMRVIKLAIFLRLSERRCLECLSVCAGVDVFDVFICRSKLPITIGWVDS